MIISEQGRHLFDNNKKLLIFSRYILGIKNLEMSYLCISAVDWMIRQEIDGGERCSSAPLGARRDFRLLAQCGGRKLSCLAPRCRDGTAMTRAWHLGGGGACLAPRWRLGGWEN